MSNSTKVGIGLVTGEITWETLGWFFPKLLTPGKGVVKAVKWMFPNSKNPNPKDNPKLKKKIKEIETVDELKEEIGSFVMVKASNASDEEKRIYKKLIGNVYNKYVSSNRKLFTNFHKDNNNREYDGFRVISSNYSYWENNKENQDDKCVFIMRQGVSSDMQIRNLLDENPQWKVLCDAAERLQQKIVIEVGLHEYRNGFAHVYRNLEGYINIGLKGDKSCFEDNGFSIFDFTFYNERLGINNLNEL